MGTARGQHTRIVAATGSQRDRIVVSVDCLLGRRDSGGGLETHSDHDVLAIADATLHPAGAVGSRAGAPVGARGERVVVLPARHGHTREARADLEALGCGQRQRGLGQIGLQLVENRLAQAGGVPFGPRIRLSRPASCRRVGPLRWPRSWPPRVRVTGIGWRRPPHRPKSPQPSRCRRVMGPTWRTQASTSMSATVRRS